MTRSSSTYRIFGVILLLILFSARMNAQSAVVRMKLYIAIHAEEAVNQMVDYKIPASVILAQAIFESRNGMSYLAKNSNNHFGIKCHTEWTGDTITRTDDTLNECFRKYRNSHESYTDHSLFLKNRPRYAKLFELPVTDYKGWCRGLQETGYATYPRYAEELIETIEEQKLYELDGIEVLAANTVSAPKMSAEIVRSRYTLNDFPLRSFTKNGLLWLDEKDGLIQSLNLIVEGGDPVTTEIADK